MGKWQLEIFRNAPCREGLLGTSPMGPFLRHTEGSWHSLRKEEEADALSIGEWAV